MPPDPVLPLMLATSRAVARLPGLANLLRARVLAARADLAPAAHGVLAWGCKPSATRAARFAGRHGLPLLRLEDGFLRSVGLGAVDPPYSLLIDDLGIYYDATRPSRLESMILAPKSEHELARSRQLVAAWRNARVSKYNHAREAQARLDCRYVLVADQTLGDASIRCGMADAGSFQRMLDAALDENPDCAVLLKVHPEVMAGRKRGHFDIGALAANPRVIVLGDDVHPVSFLEHAEAVYAVTSQVGFEGLLWGKRVRTFGMPFYAGWGLTADELPAPPRRHPVALENLVHAALIDYPRYIDPETGQPCSVERLVTWMGLQRRMRSRFPATVYAAGFSIYKRPIVRSFFQGSKVAFVRSTAAVPAGATLAVWGSAAVSRSAELHLVRLEDGFLRSVGLGADLIRPLSWVMDSSGIYYDARNASDLEQLLQTQVFDADLLARAQVLRERLVAAGLTKYNVGTARWTPPANGIRRLILVPGQVESDASLAHGASGIRRNMDLLRAVREANRDAYVIYKPHPDVVAGLRKPGKDEERVEQWCDEVVIDVPMGQLLPAMDEVHTLTSLTGFEALLRGKAVVCYGQPFYAGWGLTRDMLPLSRRTRCLSVDELLAGVLFLYPAYVSRTSGKFTTPERALEELLEWRANSSALPLWRRGMRWLLRLSRT